jgi:MFS family permease
VRAARPRLVTPTFAVVTGAALTTFISVGMLIPVLPRYVDGPLDAGSTGVGLVVGSLAFAAAVAQPALGPLSDRRGRRLLVVVGSALMALSIAGYAVATTLPVLVALRLLTGVGEAGVFVGAATAVNDLAPPERRGEAVSYFSVAVYGGLAAGPLIGEILLEARGFTTVWLTAAGFAVLGGTLGLRTPPPAARPERTTRSPRWQLHRAGLPPGVILSLAVIGFVGFAAFVPLYVATIGLDGSRFVFALYAVIVLTVRILGARLPDRLGSLRGATGALSCIAAGMLAIAVWSAPAGLYLGTVLLAMGMALLFPALMPLVVDRAPVEERGSATATFTMFFDVSQGIGAIALGVVVGVAGYNAAFALAGCLPLLGLFLLYRWFGDAAPVGQGDHATRP